MNYSASLSKWAAPVAKAIRLRGRKPAGFSRYRAHPRLKRFMAYCREHVTAT